MRNQRLGCVLVLVLVAGCDQGAEVIMSGENDGKKVLLTVVLPEASAFRKELAFRGEGVQTARERIVSQILQLHPEIGDDDFMMSVLRNEPGAPMLAGLSPRYSDVAGLIGQVIQLSQIEWQDRGAGWRDSEADSSPTDERKR